MLPDLNWNEPLAASRSALSSGGPKYNFREKQHPKKGPELIEIFVDGDGCPPE
jgi:hypothetical protein